MTDHTEQTPFYHRGDITPAGLVALKAEAATIKLENFDLRERLAKANAQLCERERRIQELERENAELLQLVSKGVTTA